MLADIQPQSAKVSTTGGKIIAKYSGTPRFARHQCRIILLFGLRERCGSFVTASYGAP
jgi:hypothetical protein